MVRRILSVALMLLAATARPALAEDGGYQLKPGDLLQVAVWKEQDLTLEVLVRPDGRFSFPLAGELKASGHTAEEVRAEIAKRLEKFIPDPEVSVLVRQVIGNNIYVIGKVNRPGAFPLPGPLDVMQALAVAGGTSTFASVNNIKVLRRAAGGQQTVLHFRYGDIEDGEALEQNVLLQSGDVVVVP